MPKACLWCKKQLAGSRFRIRGTPYSICPEHVGGLPSESSSLLYNVECTCASRTVALRCGARPHLARPCIRRGVDRRHRSRLGERHGARLARPGAGSEWYQALPPTGCCASRTARARRRVPFRDIRRNELQPNSVATAGCLRGAGGRVTVGTRAWDGLLEALRANLIVALFLNGMFSCVLWKAQPLQDVHQSTRRSQPI
jgi:hypothetical protein